MGLNTIGFYGVLVVAQKYFNDATVRRIKESSNEIGGHLILKIPLHSADNQLPVNRIADGVFSYHGEIFRSIKERRYMDTLYVYCIKDKTDTHLEKILADYSRTFTTETTRPDHRKQVEPLAKYYVTEHRTRPSNVRAALYLVRPAVVAITFYYFDLYGSIFHPPRV